MLGLPRRWLRQLTYLIGFLIVAIILLIVANSSNVIKLQDYIPTSLTPSFFQPSADSYIVDISINNCFAYNSGNKKCGIPGDSEGKYGKIPEDSSKWIKLDKDLLLGSSWIKKQFLSYKTVKSSVFLGAFEEDSDSNEKRDNNKITEKLVIIDIAISNPSQDSKIKGNEKLKLPKYIIDEFHSGKVFDDDAHKNLIDNDNDIKPIKIDLEKDKQNSASTKLSEAAKQKEFEENIQPQNPSKSDGSIEENADGDIVSENQEDGDIKSSKRSVETSRHELERMLYVPTKEDLAKDGWVYKSNGIWLRYGKVQANAVTGIDILFGEDAVDPRPNWNLIKDGPLRDIATQPDKKAYLTVRKGDKVNYKQAKYSPVLKINKNGKFKILQVADLHFSTGVGKCRDPVPSSSKKGCEADPRTLKFLEKVLELEKPDLVVLSGDQIFGETAPDSETALFKALHPFVSRKIPFAVTLGNHDHEGSLTKSEMMSLAASLPYSLAQLGPEDIDGFGNYVLTVEGPASHNPALSLFFLDTHAYSQNPKVTPGYDWIKENQLKWVEETHANMKKAIDAYTHIHLSMAFFHIPIPEYRNLHQPFIGEQKEGITAPRYNTGARSILNKVGVKVVSVGHDHCNDYCLLDIANKDSEEENKMWLCYGGGSGEGGYGGYGGYIRRLRIYEIDSNNAEIKSWKRTEQEPDQIVDTQILVTDGKVVNF
ncbi:Metallo-dependent phosphatase-like protein [Scheffersomyces amazonensis]|uniref:Metallo-dependent phosphatase-like protein n=1 Tax=Scheffersomyces amazonensis TaxID=1078765 RepID=UPI00315D1CD4